MAATTPPPSLSLPSNKPFSLKRSDFLFHPSNNNNNNNKSLFSFNSNLRCEIKGFEGHRRWTFDRISDMNKDSTALSNSSTNPSSPLVSVPAVTSASQYPTKNAKKVVLFFCAETKALAEKIAADSDAIELRTISWGKFPDGFPNIFIPNAQGIRGMHVAFLASFSSPAVIFEQIPVIYALPKLFIASFTLVLPFFPTGTSERMEDEGDIATAFTLARLLSNIPISRGGPTSLVTFDIHALQERFYFGDNILPCFESGIPLLKRRLQDLPDSDNIAIAFPDDGAWKRFHKQLQHFPTIVCAKVREGDQRIVRIKEGDPRGRHVVIVDDLVQSGGTLIECQKVLAAHGALKISAYVTHGIFPNNSWARFEHDNGGHPETAFTYFWITDSCPLTAKELMNRPPFEILSLARSISASLQI
ncbi:ribose-phosphate pyrophosphokinase 4 [Vigna radiata var. radiata]|uniref:ribose-phosphate diphosphokinase n=1 Tax=Vigna radiata var. radiata TaxID=3916 RepID=A0A1S3VLN4_VIGRR|nr:ribose-phosphate pyrophosphokinase 4 [Vigna radiata var. radiata]